jgi:hypothetical protein
MPNFFINLIKAQKLNDESIFWLTLFILTLTVNSLYNNNNNI